MNREVPSAQSPFATRRAESSSLAESAAWATERKRWDSA